MLIALAALFGHPEPGLAQTVQLDPQTTQIGVTVYVMGLLPVSGRIERFAGSLWIDPVSASTCRVSLDADIASLRMETLASTRTATGPLLLDAAHYPKLHFAGTCDGDHASGTLTLHGITRPFTIATIHAGAALEGNATLLRDDFGVSGLAGLIANRITVHLSIVPGR